MAVTNIDLKVLAQESILASKLQLDQLFSVSSKCSTASAKKGDTIKVPLYSAAATAVDFNASSANYGTDDGLNVAGKDVTLNKHKKTTAAWDEVSASRLELSKWTKMAVNSVLKAVIADVYAVVTNANFGAAAFTGAAATFDRPDLADIRKACIDAGLDSENLFMPLNTAYYAQLMKDTTINTGSTYGTNESLYEGRLRRVSGFNLIESALLPGNSENLVGFATDGRGIALANAVHAPVTEASSIVEFDTITDDVTGFTIGIRQHINPNTHAKMITLEALYGVSVADGSAIKRLVSA